MFNLVNLCEQCAKLNIEQLTLVEIRKQLCRRCKIKLKVAERFATNPPDDDGFVKLK